jgi:dihydrofolate reductase
MIISLIVAASENNAIGRSNQLLWHLPNDLKLFKNTTWGMPVIMGRKTFASVNYQPLPGRMNIVISRKPQAINNKEAIIIAGSLPEALSLAATSDAKEVFVAGGGEIYTAALPSANKVYLTRVHAYLEGDSFFPTLKEKEWQLISNRDFAADARHAYAYSFQEWKRMI